MQNNHTTSVTEAQLVGHFDCLSNQLQRPGYADRWDKPLGYWALLSDRRLPHAFLDRSLGDLVRTPFAELCATPGVGQKKVMSLVTLLTRAMQDNPPAPTSGAWDQTISHHGAAEVSPMESGVFNSAVVSEVLWSRWRETVKQYGRGFMSFGRLAPSLVSLPTAIWNTPLLEYADRTLGEIRHLKTHGEKRVNAVLEVFYTAHVALESLQAGESVEDKLKPAFIGPVESWVADTRANDRKPSREEALESLITPLLEQLALDAGSAIHSLATKRLGVEDEPQSVRNQAKELGVTRARVYQLLEECNKIMAVRWPEGESRLRGLLAQLQSAQTNREVTRFISATVDLFFPLSQSSEIAKVDTERAVVPNAYMVH